MRGMNFTNTYIGDLYIKEIDESKPSSGGHSKYWICVCPICKKEFSVRQNHLTQKQPIKMCHNCSITQRQNLIGKTFGHLTVIDMLPYEKYKRTKCLCQCDCGTTNFIVQANHLKAGEIQSCGCVLSRGEEQIANILNENNIIFEKQKIFNDCKYKQYLRFDFYLPNLNTVIEYNGIQHYEEVAYFDDTKDSLELRKIRDNIKKEYCKSKNINYLVISYKDDILSILQNNNII